MEFFLIAGGDLRFVHLANILSKKNKVYCIGFDSVYDFSDQVELLLDIKDLRGINITHAIFPLPTSIDYEYINTPLWKKKLPLIPLLDTLSKNTFIFAGKVDKKLADVFAEKKFDYADYYEREELIVLNAIPTAEGAVQIALEELTRTIYGIRCLITGYGRIAKYTGKLFHALGADVTICARKHSDLAWSRMYGCQAIHISKLEDVIENFDLIINTIPAKVFENGVLEKIHKDTLLIDLASKPGGVDFSMANDLGIRTIWALSLPGKTAPITAGEIICEAISNILADQKQ